MIGINLNNLTYCSNIHKGLNWYYIFNNLKKFNIKLKVKTKFKNKFCLGLQIHNLAVNQFFLENSIKNLESWLLRNNFYISNINGFSYWPFHKNFIKEKIYFPDWSSVERKIYTKKLIKILLTFLPKGVIGSISTLPVSYKLILNNKITDNLLNLSVINFCDVVIYLLNIFNKTGNIIHIDIEPEPNCFLSSINDVIYFFNEWLFSKGSCYIAKKLNISQFKSEYYIRNYIRICYDICHFSVNYNDHIDVLKTLNKNGIKIGRFQISSALKFCFNKNLFVDKNFFKNLFFLSKSPYLHQTFENYYGKLFKFEDLSFAFDNFFKSNILPNEWTIHYHVPIFFDGFFEIKSTQSHIIEVFNFLKFSLKKYNFEIETYTWNFLPSKIKVDILSSIKYEYFWVFDFFDW